MNPLRSNMRHASQPSTSSLSRSLLSAAIIVGLCGTVGYAGGMWWAGRTPPTSPTGPVMGELLPPVTVAVDADSTTSLNHLLTSSTTSCALLVLISTRCSFCLRMRGTWPQRADAWSDSVGMPVMNIWLAGEEESALREFYSGYDFGGVVLGRIPEDPSGAFERLGVFGTPITYLLDAEGRLRMGAMGDTLPPVNKGREVCQS